MPNDKPRDRKVYFVSPQKFTVGSSIKGSYHFLSGHLPHFFRLIYGPLLLWVLVKLAEQILLNEHNIEMTSIYYLNFITAAFAIVWYRQYLLGTDFASYRLLLKHGFTGTKISLRRIGRALVRIIVISLALLVPTLIISIGMMLYLQGEGVQFTESFIQELANKSTFVVMLIFSPILVRLSLFTAGFALGRTSLSFADVWDNTRGYTVTLWWVAIRGFLPLSIYSYILTWFLRQVAEKMSVHYIISTIFIETVAGFLTFMMLSIVVAANAEAFRVLIGVRDGDVPHRPDAGAPRERK